MLRLNFSLIKFLSNINSIVYKNHNIFTYSIPNVAIKSVVDMTVLMMIVVKHTVRLPRLPPLRLERDSRVLHDTVIVGVQRQPVKRYYNKRIFTNTSCYHKVDWWVSQLKAFIYFSRQVSYRIKSAGTDKHSSVLLTYRCIYLLTREPRLIRTVKKKKKKCKKCTKYKKQSKNVYLYVYDRTI